MTTTLALLLATLAPSQALASPQDAVQKALPATAARPETRPSPLTIEDAHRAFVGLVRERREQLKKGELRQPPIAPWQAGDLFIKPFGWIRPEVLDFCLTLKPLQLQRKGNEGSAYLTLGAPARFQVFAGRWDPRWDADRWAARLQWEDGRWRVKSVDALVGKPTSSPPQPTGPARPLQHQPRPGSQPSQR